MNALAQSPLLGRGLYPLREAARLVQLSPQTARRWANGNKFTYQGQPRSSSGFLETELPRVAGIQDLTFPELLTLRMVRSFKQAGLGLPTIKRVAERAAQDYGGITPLVTKTFRTDGRRIFLELRSEEAANDGYDIPRNERRLIDVLSGQEQFAHLVEPSLFQNLDWEDGIMASRWWPAGREAGVVLDPGILFGAPRLDRTSIPTAAVAQAVRAEAGGEAGIAAVAEWLGIAPEQVKQAVIYETEWLAQAA